MAQQIRTIKNGVTVEFTASRLIPIRATTNRNLLRVLDAVSNSSDKAFAVINTTLSKGHFRRQVSTIMGVLVSPEYWEDILAGADPLLVKQIEEVVHTDDFIIEGDRFSKIIPTTAPTQHKLTKIYEIKEVDESGQVDLEVPFVASSLSISGATASNTFPSTGLLAFDAEDIGKIITVSFVTAPKYQVIKIARIKEDSPYINIGTLPRAYLLHPTLANELSLTLPTV